MKFVLLTGLVLVNLEQVTCIWIKKLENEALPFQIIAELCTGNDVLLAEKATQEEAIETFKKFWKITTKGEENGSNRSTQHKSSEQGELACDM